MFNKVINKENVLRIVCILTGTFIMAFGINAFIIPHKLLSGGIAGLSIILQYLTNIPAGIFVLLLNIPIFLIGMKKVDRNFAFISLVGMLSLSFFLVITKYMSSLVNIDDILASCVYGGLFSGAGAGIIFRNRASTGGTDIISVVLKKYFEISISSLLFSMNIVIVLIGATLNSLEIAIYTLISMFISSTVMNKIIDGLDRKKLLMIVTKKEKDVSKALINEIKRGVTFLDGEGAYTGEKKKIIYCVVSLRQLAKVKKIIDDIDNTSFMSILDTSEIYGKGFKKPVF